MKYSATPKAAAAINHAIHGMVGDDARDVGDGADDGGVDHGLADLPRVAVHEADDLHAQLAASFVQLAGESNGGRACSNKEQPLAWTDAVGRRVLHPVGDPEVGHRGRAERAAHGLCHAAAGAGGLGTPAGLAGAAEPLGEAGTTLPACSGAAVVAVRGAEVRGIPLSDAVSELKTVPERVYGGVAQVVAGP